MRLILTREDSRVWGNRIMDVASDVRGIQGDAFRGLGDDNKVKVMCRFLRSNFRWENLGRCIRYTEMR